MSQFVKKALVSIAVLSGISANLASAQALKSLKFNESIILKTPVTCLTCPDLTKLPKFEEGLTLEDKQHTIALMDDAFRNLKDLPELSGEIRSSVDFWERLNPVEKQNILDHRFGDQMNAAVAGVVIAAAALAWDVYKDYRQTKWNPADMGFDRIRTVGALDYMKTANFRFEAVRSLQSRLNAFHGLSHVAHGLNY